MPSRSRARSNGSQLGRKEALTVEEAARRLSIGRGLAYEMVRQGKIPAIRLGRVIRIPNEALDAMLAAPPADSGSQSSH